MILCCRPWVTPLWSPRDQFVCTWSRSGSHPHLLEPHAPPKSLSSTAHAQTVSPGPGPRRPGRVTTISALS